MSHSTIDCSNGAQGIYHHNQLTLADSTVRCSGGYGIYDYHGEDMLRRSTITGGLSGIYAHDTESTVDEPDNPTEVIGIYNCVVGGGAIGAEIKWMTAEIENSVFWGTDAGVSLLEMGGATIRSSGFVDSSCGITTDQQFTFANNGFWDLGTNVCGGNATGAVTADPLLVSFPTDLHLGLGSPWIDTGNPADRDTDATRADIGQYGGALPPL
ncbi:MAG: right-handed parallel beta-helix repeat-containing protein [Deltaproteobacteria bacterium]|nr:right-handed parallel beta-helix repeat-containing protein [Deltaproteobacteria bacterium]